MRKPTSAIERELTEAQQMELMELLNANDQTYADVIPVIQERWGLTVSDSQLSRFWQRYCSPYLLASRLQSKALADDLRGQMKEHPAAFTEAAIEQLCQMAFDLSTQRKVDPDKLRTIFALVLKAKDQELKVAQIAQTDRRIKLLEAKAAQADQAREVINSTLTPEEQRARLKEILK